MVMFKHLVTSLCLLWAVFAVALSAQSQSLPNLAQRAKADRQPTKVEPEKFFRQKSDYARLRAGGRYHVLLHPGEGLTAERQAALAQRGIRLTQYAGAGTWWAEVGEQATAEGIAQVYVAQPADKAAEGLLAGQIPAGAKSVAGQVDLDLMVAPSGLGAGLQAQLAQAGATVLAQHEQFNLVRVRVPEAKLADLLAQPQVYWAEPNQELALHDEPSRNHYRANVLAFRPSLGVSGAGVGIGQWDGGMMAHIDMTGRITQVEPNGSQPIDNIRHGTNVMGIMAGGGWRYPTAVGIAPGASVFFHTISGAFPDNFIPYEMFQAEEARGINITQNSYGPTLLAGCTGMPYSTLNRAVDQLVNVKPHLFHAYASGNSGSACSGFRSVVNVPKNAVVVGNVNAFADFVEGSSSRGPSRDGRLFPHVVVAGGSVLSLHDNNNYSVRGSATSMACPQVSGGAALLYELFGKLNGGAKADATLVKAVMCNGATDIGNPGPDYLAGFGKLNLLNAAKALESRQYELSRVAQGGLYTKTIDLAGNVRRLKVMLAWNDPAAMPTNGPALVNDLNLVLVGPGGQTVLPWVLSNVDGQLNNPAVRGVDNLNNIEQVTIDAPASGQWRLEVRGANVPVGPNQSFALTWQADTDYLQMTYPNGGEKLPALNEQGNAVNYRVHWDGEGLTGNLTLEMFNGSAWTVINAALPATARFADVTLANTLVTGQGRFRIRGQGVGGATLSDESDAPFHSINVPIYDWISPWPQANDVVNLSWNAVSGASAYDVLQFDASVPTWRTIGTVNAPTTTFNVANLPKNQTYWFAIRPRAVVNGVDVVGERAPGRPVTLGATAVAGTDLELTALFASPRADACYVESEAQPVRILLTNRGSALASGVIVPALYQINTLPAVNQNLVLNRALATGDTIGFWFIQRANFAQPGDYAVRASISPTGDLVTANNTQQISFKVVAPPLISATAYPAAATPQGKAYLSIPGLPVNQYELSQVSFAPENMAGATVVDFGQATATGAIDLGFDFKFYNETYRQLYITREGLVSFDGFDLSYIDNVASMLRPIPSPVVLNNYIAAAWSDLTGGSVKYKVVGTAPSRKFVVAFEEMQQATNTEKLVTAQIVLHEGTNLIEVHTTRADPYDRPMTMGIESRMGQFGTAVPGRNAELWADSVANEGRRFTPTIPNLEWPDGSNTAVYETNGGGTYHYGYRQFDCYYPGATDIFDTQDQATPLVAKLSPVNGTVNVPTTNLRLTLEFNENVRPGNAGNLVLASGAGNLIVPVRVAGGFNPDIEVVGKVVNIQLRQNLVIDQVYTVTVPAGAFIDYGAPANSYQGTNTWTFSTAVQPVVTWNGTAWTPGQPSTYTDAVVAAHYPNGQAGAGSFEAKGLTVNAGAKLTIGNQQTVAVRGTFRYLGEVEVMHAGAFVQAEGSPVDPASTGTFRLRKNGQTAVAYNFWAAPVANFAVTSLPSFNNARFVFSEATAAWPAASGLMEAGRGYTAIQAGEVVFSGAPHNGTLVRPGVTLTGGSAFAGFNLVGNPYPSPLSLRAFFAANPQLDGTAWLWQDNGQGQGRGNYVALNLLSDVPQVATAQGFFVRRNDAQGSNDVLFTNAQRAGGAPQFFRGEGDAPERVRVLVRRADGLQDQVLVGFHDEFTTGIDRLYDGKKMDGNGQLSLAAQQNGGRYANTALPKSELAGGFELPLHLQVGQSGTYTFQADDQLPGPASQVLFLEDRQAQEWYYLQPGREHTISLPAGNHQGRFYLRKGGEVVGATASDTPVAAYSFGSQVYVQFAGHLTETAQAYIVDQSGNTLLSYANLRPAAKVVLPAKVAVQGVYILKIVSQAGVFSQKIWLD
jgi:hypothetical protein